MPILISGVLGFASSISRQSAAYRDQPTANLRISQLQNSYIVVDVEAGQNNSKLFVAEVNRNVRRDPIGPVVQSAQYKLLTAFSVQDERRSKSFASLRL